MQELRKRNGVTWGPVREPAQNPGVRFRGPVARPRAPQAPCSGYQGHWVRWGLPKPMEAVPDSLFTPATYNLPHRAVKFHRAGPQDRVHLHTLAAILWVVFFLAPPEEPGGEPARAWGIISCRRRQRVRRDSNPVATASCSIPLPGGGDHPS